MVILICFCIVDVLLVVQVVVKVRYQPVHREPLRHPKRLLLRFRTFIHLMIKLRKLSKFQTDKLNAGNGFVFVVLPVCLDKQKTIVKRHRQLRFEVSEAKGHLVGINAPRRLPVFLELYGKQV